MKSLNTVKYITESTLAINKWLGYIGSAESWDDARKAGNSAIGYIDSMVTFLNCMVCEENNGFTQELDDVIENWLSETYQAMANKAIELGEPDEKVWELLKKRDEHRAEA